MQPVQDLTIEGTVSRTQYQFILQDADPAQLAEWTPKLVDKLRTLAAIRRRRERHRGAGPVGLRPDRPRPGGALRHHAGDHRQCAVRFLRPAHRLDHLHQLQPVPRDPGGRSGAAELAEVAERHLSAVVGRLDAGAAGGDGEDDARPPRRCRSRISGSSRPPPSRSTSRPALRSATPSRRSSRRRSISASRSASSPASRARRWRSSPRCPTSCS